MVIRFKSEPSPERKKQRDAIAEWDTAKYGDISQEWAKVRGAVSDPDPNSPAYKRAYELYTVYQIRLQRARHKTFIVTGEVVDDEGRPLSEVAMNLTKSTDKVGGWESENEEVDVRLKSRFQFTVEGGHILHVGFWKRGYYAVRTSIVDPDGDEHDAMAMLNALKTDSFSRREVKKHLRIVLEKQGKLTRLRKYHERLQFNADGSGRAVDFDKPASNLFEKSLYFLKNASDRSTWPKHAAVLTAETSGTAVVRAIPSVLHRSTSGTVRAPVRAQLRMSHSEDGIQLFDFNRPPLSSQVDPTKPWRSWRIKQAPRDGYSREITLDAAALKDESFPFFYFRIAGKYGWGQVHHLDVANGGETLECRVEFRLQPDGSRNLEEGRGP